MNNIFPKVSLFDTLAMMIPGGATLAILISCFGYHLQTDRSIEIEEWIIYTIILVACYLLGNIINGIMDIIWYPIRNNPIFLKASEDIYESSLQANDSYYLCRNLVLLVISTGIIVIETMALYCKQCFEFTSIVFVLFLFIAWFVRQIKDKQKLVKYYEQYYYVAKNSTNNNISIIEAQIAFMRNMLFPLIIFSILKEKTLFPDYFPELNETGLIAAGSFLLFVTIIIRQHKVHIIVWDDYKYLNLLKKEDKSTCET